MAGADKKGFTRDYIENVEWNSHQAFIYGFLDKGDSTIQEEIEIYAKGTERWKYDDDLIPALVALHFSQDVKNLLQIAEQVVKELPKEVITTILDKLKEEGNEEE
jgi:hypothetical protein